MLPLLKEYWTENCRQSSVTSKIIVNLLFAKQFSTSAIKSIMCDPQKTRLCVCVVHDVKESGPD